MTASVPYLIIGSGPGGYTAAIYMARANFKPVLYQGILPGGQINTTTAVENYPGYPSGISGPELMEAFALEAKNMGAELRNGTISKVDITCRPFVVEIDEKQRVTAQVLILATGAAPKWPGLEEEPGLHGHGVSACGICDGFFFKDQEVAAIGHIPNSKLFEGQLDIDEEGYVITRPNSTKTSVEGVFACGDVQDRTFRQAVVAAGSGALAALEAIQYLHGNKMEPV